MDLKNLLSSSKDTKTPPTKVEDLFEVWWEESAKSKAKKSLKSSDLSLLMYGDWTDPEKTVEAVNDMFLQALMKKASDIHIEPREKLLRIRFRVDWYYFSWNR